MPLALTLTAAALLVPMPPSVQFVQGPIPGDTGTEISPAATDGAVVYHEQPLSPFARAHEVGHLLDHQVLTDGDRRYFARLMRGPGVWRHGSAEWFADYYAAAATRLDLRRGSVVSYATFGPRRLERFKRALDRLGHRYRLEPYGSGTTK